MAVVLKSHRNESNDDLPSFLENFREIIMVEFNTTLDI